MEEKDRFTYLRHRKNGYIYFSPSFSKIFGNVSSKKLKDEGIECFLEEGDKERFRTAEVETLQGERKRSEFSLITYQGDKRLFMFSMTPMWKGEKVIGYQAIAEDITSLRLYEESLLRALEEKNAILSELHHRVNNNLMVIIGLIDIYGSGSHSDEVKEVLKDIKARILAISTIHKFIHGQEGFADVDLESYLRSLLNRIEDVYDAHGVTIEVDATNVQLDYNTLADLSMVIGELASNSLKYAFPSSKGNIHLAFYEEGDKYVVTYSDDGTGLKEFDGIDSGFGLELIRRIILNKMKGSINLKTEKGTDWTIVFPKNRVSDNLGMVKE